MHFRFMRRRLLLFMIFISLQAGAQNTNFENDTVAIDAIYKHVLTESVAYDWLEGMCKQIGHRLSGSANYHAAVEYFRQIMDTIGLDTIYVQELWVPHWERGEAEQVRVISSSEGAFDYATLALGNSLGTGPDGLTAEVIEVHTLEELEEMADEDVTGKIIFFNRPMDQSLINMLNAYVRAADQRTLGPAMAADKGAAGAIVRSLASSTDHIPHTGSTNYRPDGRNIPALSISTADADHLSRLLRKGEVTVFMRNTSHFLSDKKSFNLIGEIRGQTHADEIILVSGHLDSWDVGDGAHDDGAGCVHAIDVLHTYRKMGYKPRRTIRAVLYSNEENGLRGGNAYADQALSRGEYHLAALESDLGGFTPRQFNFEAERSVFIPRFRAVGQWSDLMEPYGITFGPGGSGADISPLKPQGALLIGFRPDTQRYFDLHHSPADVFETVNKRELHLGSASIAALIFLIDKHGLPD